MTGDPDQNTTSVDDRTVLSTVSLEFVQELLVSIRRITEPERFRGFLEAANLQGVSLHEDGIRRVSHHQLVRLYQVAAVGTGDEMMGLWSRPIRSGALKYICKAVIDAPTVERALYRFCQFWNLLLDDYRLELREGPDGATLSLEPAAASPSTNRFGQVLMLKLTHGIASWLAGHELPCEHLALAFPRPSFADDYPILFPAAITFDARCSSVCFSADAARLHVVRRPSDVRGFLERAPRDWIYTGIKEHAIQLKLREFLQRDGQLDASLADAAEHFHVSPRTLVRRLAAEDLSFQEIKDGLRRDVAIHELQWTTKNLDQISYDLGFSSVAVFHRAFKNWTGTTPGQYRRGNTPL